MTTSSAATALSSRPTELKIRDLGAVMVERDGQLRPVPAGRLARGLALLLANAGRRVTYDAMVAAMWRNDSAPRSKSTVDSHVFRLRQLLEPFRPPGEKSTVLVRDSNGYRLAAPPDQVDSLRFARLAVAADDLLAKGSPDDALRLTEEALASWRGRPYGDAADEPWAAAAVGRLEELYAQVQETQIGALLESGATERALTELEVALAEHPLRERLWAQRMIAYRDSGRRGDALAAYTRARTTLVEELGIEPGPELRHLHAALLSDDATTTTTQPVRRRVGTPVAVHLPVPRYRIIGRDAEIAELTAAIDGQPLVTVTGPAGCGKTRLAVETAQRGAARFPDGVWFVDLTSATSERVLDTVCSAVELAAPASGSALTGLRNLVRDRRMLLVLDNCEHVLDSTAELVEELLADDPECAVLATSREPLEVAGERVHLLEPLAAAPAVELLLERLDSVAGRDVGHSAGDIEIAGEIASAVDGLPLALELAAGRARAYSLTEIAVQVRADASSLSRVGRGGNSHQHTIRGAIDSSYRALSEPEAALHRAAGVVPGPFTAGLAAALVGQDPGDTADLITGLVHRSLLTSLGSGRAGGPSRFAQLATVRGHALHQPNSGDQAPRDMWVEHLVDARPRFGSSRTADWYGALDDDSAALRATLHHTLVDAPAATGPAIVARLSNGYYTFHHQRVEGLHWARTAIAACEQDPSLARAADLSAIHGWVGAVLSMRQLEQGRQLVRLALAEARAAEPADTVRVCTDLTVITGALYRGRHVDLLTELAATVRELGGSDPTLDVTIRHAEILAQALVGRGPELVTRLTALHADACDDDNLHTAFATAAAAAQMLLAAGRPDEALTMGRASITACVELGINESTFTLEVLGCALALTGKPAEAARAFALAEADNIRSGRPWPTADVTGRLIGEVAATLGSAGLEQARAEAHQLSLADLVDAE